MCFLCKPTLMSSSLQRWFPRCSCVVLDFCQKAGLTLDLLSPSVKPVLSFHTVKLVCSKLLFAFGTMKFTLQSQHLPLVAGSLFVCAPATRRSGTELL